MVVGGLFPIARLSGIQEKLNPGLRIAEYSLWKLLLNLAKNPASGEAG